MARSEDVEQSMLWDTLLEHVWELWVGPELEARGLSTSRDSIQKVIVELPPGERVVVRLDDEATIELGVLSTRPIEAGDEVSVSDIAEVKSVRPIGVGENSGWLCFFRLPTGEAHIAFDFIYNRGRAHVLLDRAAEFLASARAAAETSQAVCLDNAFSAAELAVQIEMLFIQQETTSHRVRGEWLAEWAGLGNAPESHSHVLWQLADLRKRARYGLDPVTVSADRREQLLAVVTEMIERAATRIKLTPRTS